MGPRAARGTSWPWWSGRRPPTGTWTAASSTPSSMRASSTSAPPVPREEPHSEFLFSTMKSAPFQEMIFCSNASKGALKCERIRGNPQWHSTIASWAVVQIADLKWCSRIFSSLQESQVSHKDACCHIPLNREPHVPMSP